MLFRSWSTARSPRAPAAPDGLALRLPPASTVTLAAVPRLTRGLALVQGLGIAIVSTSKGVLSDRKCRDQRVGGELLCIVE